MDDPYHLERFTAAQEHAYAGAIDELRRGRKTSHWMWYVFPQLVGLGHSATARHFGIVGDEEARAYLDHPLLGPRLREAAGAILDAAGSAEQILGDIDAMKLRSSMTLFAAVATDPTPFAAVLSRFFDGEPDAATLTLLEG